METDILLNPSPLSSEHTLIKRGDTYRCEYSGLTVKPKTQLFGLRKTNQYAVLDIDETYSIAGKGIVGQNFTLTELQNFSESVYPDHILAEFAEGNYDNLTMPKSTLTQILLEQLREVCYMQISGLRRAHGPTLEPGGDRFPKDTVSNAGLTWQDKGNLFLTNARLVFPSNSFTFIRMDRKLAGVKAYQNGLAVQRKGESFATYFMGCGAHQAALAVAYIMGKIPQLRKEEVR